VNNDGVEVLLAVARRSRWLILILVALGAGMMTILGLRQMPEYRASARVILAPSDLASVVAGSSGYVDPQLVDDTENALAASRQLYARTAQLDPTLTVGEISSATSSSKKQSTVTFNATTDNPALAVRIASSVARTYPKWRAEVSSRVINLAIEQLSAQQRAGGPNPDLVDELNRLKVMKTVNSGNVLLVETPSGAAKIRPTPVRDAIIGAFIGLFVALVAVGIREAIDTKVRLENEVEEILDVPVIGTVERLPKNATLIAPGGVRERFSDMYSLLAAHIVHARTGEKRTRIAVTSATSAEGKTTTAANLAVALTRGGHRVLLVDFDTRRPSIVKLFGIPAGGRGVEALDGRDNGGLSALTWGVDTNGSGFRIEPPPTAAGEAGSAALNVLPLFISGNGASQASIASVREILGRANDYDYIVIDTPPALSVPNVTEISELLDMALVVVRYGRVSRRNLAGLGRIHRRWTGVDVNAVLVGVPPHARTYEYYDNV
jgi:Mrp family chromosome partitioning ATPase